MDGESMMSEESGEQILRTREEFSEATMGSIVHMNESRAIWMDRILGKALDAVVDRLAAVQEIVHSAGDDPEWEKMPTHLRDVVWISHEAVNGTIAAYQLVRHGYWQESLVLVRHLIEVVSLMLHLCVEPEIRPDFVTGKWRTTKSIGPAAKIIPPIGPMYGHLSDHTHPLYEFLVGKSGLTRERTDERLTYSIGGGMYPEKEFFFRHAIRDILGVGMLLHAVAEYAFRHKVKDFRFWRVDGERLVWQPIRAEQAKMKEMADFGGAEDNLVPKQQYQDFKQFRAAYTKRHRLIYEAMEEIERGRAEQTDRQA